MNYRFGIIGTGLIANTHVKALDYLPNTELVGVADVNAERAKAFAAPLGVRVYETVEELLSDETLDAVCICTPSGFHCENAITALDHKKHVVLEKPMALNTADADKIIEACERNGKELTVISQMRFADKMQDVRKIIRDGGLGKISMVSLYLKYWRDESYFSQSNWRGTKKYDGGGALMNQGIHGVDLMQYMVGPAHVTAASARTRTHAIEVEDTVNALLAFDDGSIGTIEASTCAYPGFPRRLEIIGDRGHVVFRETEIESLAVNGEIVFTSDKVVDKDSARSPAIEDCRKHARQIANLLAHIEGKEELIASPADSRDAVRCIEEVYQKAEM